MTETGRFTDADLEANLFDKLYCDNCGDCVAGYPGVGFKQEKTRLVTIIPWHDVGDLRFDIDSALKGESAHLCDRCFQSYELNYKKRWWHGYTERFIRRVITKDRDHVIFAFVALVISCILIAAALIGLR